MVIKVIETATNSIRNTPIASVGNSGREDTLLPLVMFRGDVWSWYGAISSVFPKLKESLPEILDYYIKF